MLETVWYLLVLVLQILQVNPQIMADKLQIDVFVASKPAYSFVVQGNAVQGQVLDGEKRAVFGEFEATRRLPQAYVVFPRVALDPEVEAAAMAGLSQGKDGSGGKSDAKAAGAQAPSGKPAGTDAAAGAKKKELYPFTLDFTKTLKLLASFRDKPRQQFEYPEYERFLATSDQKDAAAKDAKSAKPAASPAAPAPSSGTVAAGAAKTGTALAASAGAGNTAGTAPAGGAAGAAGEDKKPVIEIRQYANRLVVTADFIQTVMVVNFMQ